MDATIGSEITQADVSLLQFAQALKRIEPIAKGAELKPLYDEMVMRRVR